MLLAPGPSGEAAIPEAGGVPAGLCYSSDAEPGITRLRRGNHFAYRDSEGGWIKDEAQLARIRRLAIPPGATAASSTGCCHSPGRCRACAARYSNT